jgi:hypothetical protein
MAKCPKVACPVIKIQCTDAQKAKKKCYVKVGGTVYHTKTNQATGRKVSSLIQAQKKQRCTPLIKSSGTGAAQAAKRMASAIARQQRKALQAASAKARRVQTLAAKKAKQATLKQIARDARDRRKAAEAEYKATLSVR